MGYIAVALIVVGGYFYITSTSQKVKKNDLNKTSPTPTVYKERKLMTTYEYQFYNILKELEGNYHIIPQANLASIIDKKNNNYFYTELFRNVDFAIFDKNFNKVLLLIEIDDQTHKQYKRFKRDINVNKICRDANIKIIHFYSNYPNKKDYVINRINKEINKNISNE